MRIRRRKRDDRVQRVAERPSPTRPGGELVQIYLRAQNLEQMRHTDEAAALYEEAVAARFDAAGPYDRLIAIYGGRNDHVAVRRIAEAALVNVRTHDQKLEWYESVRSGAVEAEGGQGDRRGAEF